MCHVKALDFNPAGDADAGKDFKEGRPVTLFAFQTDCSSCSVGNNFKRALGEAFAMVKVSFNGDRDSSNRTGYTAVN